MRMMNVGNKSCPMVANVIYNGKAQARVLRDIPKHAEAESFLHAIAILLDIVDNVVSNVKRCCHAGNPGEDNLWWKYQCYDIC
jgi:hypothetical protein